MKRECQNSHALSKRFSAVGWLGPSRGLRAWFLHPYFVLKPKPIATVKAIAYLQRDQKGNYLIILRHLKLEFQSTSLFFSDLWFFLGFTKVFSFCVFYCCLILKTFSCIENIRGDFFNLLCIIFSFILTSEEELFFLLPNTHLSPLSCLWWKFIPTISLFLFCSQSFLLQVFPLCLWSER